MFGSSNRTIIQQTSKTTQNGSLSKKNQASAMAIQSSDLNPVENEWGELKRKASSWSCESEGSGEILDEGMVSDLLSGVL